MYLQVLLGLVWEGEGLGPKRVEGRVMEKVNPSMDKAGNFVPGIFLRVPYRAVELKSSLKLIGYCVIWSWLVNIIETSNDIDETGDLEATFTLDNMELRLAMPGRQCPVLSLQGM